VRSVPCTWSLKTKVDSLSVVWPQNHWDNFLSFGLKTGADSFLRFSHKTTGMVFSGLASKPVVIVFSGLALKPVATISPGLASKSVARVFRFGPQNPQLLYRARGASKPRSMVCQWFGLKTTGMVFSSLASKPVATVFSSLALKPVVMVSPVWPQNRWLGIPSLGHKTGSYSLVIWASKSPQRFLGLGLKTRQGSICLLHHKTDGWMMAWDTHRDLAASFTWKQVGLGFPSLPQN
jgi:hypothetical protein